ncbi:major membrane immunogen, membrane-anchored lipoprotein [Sphaerochaeta pleomorpha str. Grapes]|uniref:Major membrane immunogen, membrane-anchored lipoprotein n=1 Tax=Sphaerochaeta pleomorpha (strain ATCC BAA-1885 / DSM 22778 / Grapes) TaxID=158190 RepID=G8QQ71_SPHPG|nr:major membrane immunogen, membrane-anchored lipoprotein [Sphaerochaeta pleomorpha]AEV28648.1 major membrane immunogen, membrane-anchored lipoprotein [Sphaerochaeta pleomorpha str. Grapes]
MKRNSLLTCLVLLSSVALLVTGCSKEAVKSETEAAETVVKQVVAAPVPAKQAEPAKYADGIYFAMDDAFASSGWKETATVTVQGGKIVSADWNGVNSNGGADKKTFDKAGKYNMVKFGNAQADWSVQAAKAEAYLVSTQDPAKITYKDNEGHTDDIAGVSVHVSAFFNLAAKALSAGPVGRGPLADGVYFAIDEAYASSGWKDYVSLTVINGRIAGADWSGVNMANQDKKAFDKAGNYNMVKFGGAQADWYVQAEKAEAYLIANQDFAKLSYSDNEGHTDDIAGVSVHVGGFANLVGKALAAGPVAIGSYADGTYFASEDAFGSTGWKETVSLFVSNGRIVNVNWSGVNENGDDKKAYSADGSYGMVAIGKASAEWHVQAAAVENYLLSTQDPAKISYKDSEGHTDDIGGASIHVSSFFTLVNKALAAGVVKK